MLRAETDNAETKWFALDVRTGYVCTDSCVNIDAHDFRKPPSQNVVLNAPPPAQSILTPFFRGKNFRAQNESCS